MSSDNVSVTKSMKGIWVWIDVNNLSMSSIDSTNKLEVFRKQKKHELQSNYYLHIIIYN